MLRWDRHLETWLAGHRVSWLDPVFRWLTYAGIGGIVWLALGALLALAWRRIGPLLAVAIADAAAQAVTWPLQRAIGRQRPRVHTLVAEPHSHSFPSGHAASSFACAVVLGAAVPPLRIPLLVLAALVAFSRAYVGVHYPLDVVGGAVLGTLLGLAVLALAPRATGGFRSSSGSRAARRGR